MVDDPKQVVALKTQLNSQLLFRARVFDTDVFTDLINSWPRGDQSLDLQVERGGQLVQVGPFVPRTLGLHPTQVYETVSMILPPPTGGYSFDGTAEGRVDNREFYGGHKDELILTVRRER